MSSGKRERTTSQPAQQPAKPKSDAAKSPRPSKTRVAIFIPILLILLCLVLIILIAPLSASLLIDDDDARDGNSAGVGSNAGRIPAKIFKLVPFFFLVQSDNPINRIQYYYGATNSCAYQLTTAAGKNATGTAICGKTGVVKFLTAKEGPGSVTATGSLVKFDDYYRRRVAATTSALLSIECLIITVILAISLYSIYADYRSSSAQRAKDAAGGSKTAYSDARKALVAADDKAHRVAKWTEGWPIISAHVVGIIFLVVCIAVIAAGSEQQVPAGMSASPAWGLGLVILAGVLHVTCVMTPLIVAAMRKRRAKSSKNKSKGGA